MLLISFSKLHCGLNKTTPLIEFTVTFGVLNIESQAFACLYFYQFQAVYESFMKIDKIVLREPKQVSEIF